MRGPGAPPPGLRRTLRVQIRNAPDYDTWQTTNIPGGLPLAGPRTLLAYVTTDF